MLFHSAQKSCQEATWEFPQTEIELVLTQAEQKAVAETWIIVPYKVLYCHEDTETCLPSYSESSKVLKECVVINDVHQYSCCSCYL